MSRIYLKWASDCSKNRRDRAAQALLNFGALYHSIAPFSTSTYRVPYALIPNPRFLAVVGVVRLGHNISWISLVRYPHLVWSLGGDSSMFRVLWGKPSPLLPISPSLVEIAARFKPRSTRLVKIPGTWSIWFASREAQVKSSKSVESRIKQGWMPIPRDRDLQVKYLSIARGLD